MAYADRVAWDVVLDEEVETWFLDLCKTDPDSGNLIAAAIDKLSDDGPVLGRPLVDRITASRHHNMKELRPGSSGGSEIRILFAFDPLRQAILLVAGDKAGNWRQWYIDNIPIADDRLDEHLTTLAKAQARGGGN